MTTTEIQQITLRARLDMIEHDLLWLSEQDACEAWYCLDHYYASHADAAWARWHERGKLLRDLYVVTWQLALDTVGVNEQVSGRHCQDCGGTCEPDSPFLCADCTSALRLRRLAETGFLPPPRAA